MPTTANQCIESAIGAIRSFLEHTESDLLGADGEQLRRLARRIQAARVARRRTDRAVAEPYVEALHARYQEYLQKLHVRLGELQQALLSEREASLQEQARVARTREWHHSLSTTQ